MKSIKRDVYAKVKILNELLYAPFYVRREKMKIVRKMHKISFIIIFSLSLSLASLYEIFTFKLSGRNLYFIYVRLHYAALLSRVFITQLMPFVSLLFFLLVFRRPQRVVEGKSKCVRKKTLKLFS